VSPVSTSRHDSSWRPGLGDPSTIVEAFSGPPVFRRTPPRGISRASADWRPGLGEIGQATSSEQQVQQISAIASAGASATVGILVALGTIGGPVGAAVAGLIAVSQILVGIFKGCGQTCVEATDIVNQVEPVLQQNLATYLASSPRTASLQAAAVNNFQTAWNAVLQNCNNPQLAAAGQNCISQRQNGACAYKTSPGGWQQSGSTWTYVYPGANGSGSTCWNWFVGYLDPIQNDPTVVADSVALSSDGTTSTESATETDYTPLLLIGGILLGLMLL